MKVAQYEVLGNNAKRDVRPGRDDRSVSAPGPQKTISAFGVRGVVGGSGDFGVRINVGGLRSLLLARLRRLGRVSILSLRVVHEVRNNQQYNGGR